MARPKLAINRDTRSELIQVTQDMIQTKGFYAFTFQELSNKLKIRKASIHYKSIGLHRRLSRYWLNFLRNKKLKQRSN
jgi:hypothetical protein